MGRTPDLGMQAELLRNLAREANGTIKDLRNAISEARKTGPAIVAEHMDTAITDGLRTYGETIEKEMAAAATKVNSEFGRLSDILMGRTAADQAAGKRSIPDLVHDMTREPETVTDPRQLGGNLTGGGPHDQGGTVVDTRGAVILDFCEVAVATGADNTDNAITLLMGGRVNGTRDQAKILYIIGEDGAAALVTQIEALVRRGAAAGWSERYAAAKARREAQMHADGTWQ